MDNDQARRAELDGIDREMLRLFERRMALTASLPPEDGEAAQDAAWERKKLREAADSLPEPLQDYGVALCSLLLDLSRSQRERGAGTALTAEIERAIRETPPLFPESAAVACQGVEGAYSQLACERLFLRPDEYYFKTFDAVFSSIEQGLCRFGVIPLENSTAGSVNMVYDLMMRHHFHIVRSVRVKVDHNLLVRPGTRLEDIREVFSHEQALSQSGRFLSTLKDVRLTRCGNTAEAARLVRDSERNDVAALCSRACAPLYGLEVLRASVQDQGNNFTRFICISKDLEIYPGADRTSLMAVLPHRPGALYKLLARFYALGINLNKLESRPIPERNFEFMFYFDLETSVYSPRFIQLMGELQGVCEHFSYLGSYSEVI